MSKTRKTAPSHVRLRQARLTKEVHDHRYGTCDLGKGAPLISFFERDVRCYLGPSQEFWYGHDSGCPCWMCHDSYGNKASRRAARHRAVSKISKLHKVLYAKGSLDDVDW
jgi:hypothetical protein